MLGTHQFNDPFEFTPRTANVLDDPEALNISLNANGIQASIESVEKVLPLLRQTSPIVRDHAKFLEQMDLNSREDASKDHGVICFTSKPNDTCMWSHYGDKHRGVAIGFDFAREADGLDGVLCVEAVRYAFQRPPLTVPRRSKKEFLSELKEVALTKSIVWQNEDEHRMFILLGQVQREPAAESKTSEFNHFLPIQAGTVCEVVLGCGLSLNDEVEVRSLCAAKLPEAKVVKLARHPANYELVEEVASETVNGHTTPGP